MPLFFFHYHTPDTSTRDDAGCEFATLEHAYVDAYRSAIDIGAEMLKAHQNPTWHRIEIADDRDRVLAEIRFEDIFRRRSADARPQVLLLHERLRRFQALRGEMIAMCSVAQKNVDAAHAVLRRARALV